MLKLHKGGMEDCQCHKSGCTCDCCPDKGKNNGKKNGNGRPEYDEEDEYEEEDEE